MIPAAARERQAVALGRSLRKAARVIQLPEAGALGPLLAPGRLGRDGGAARPYPPGREDRRAPARRSRRSRSPICAASSSARCKGRCASCCRCATTTTRTTRPRPPCASARTWATCASRRCPCCATCSRARSTPAPPTTARSRDRYDEMIAGLRLAGTLPSGLFGTVLRPQHLMTLAVVARRPARRAGAGDCPPASRRSGTAPRPSIAATSRSRRRSRCRCRCPMARARSRSSARASSLTTIDGDALAVTLVMSRSRGEDTERDRLRAWLTHLTRAASGVGRGPQARLARARRQSGWRRTEGPCGIRADGADRRPRAPGRRWRRELLSGVHAYFMPCEGIFTWRRRQRREQPMTVPQAVLLVRDDGFTRVSSDRGPVGDARRYPVPDEADANARVARRFRPYFDAIGESKVTALRLSVPSRARRSAARSARGDRGLRRHGQDVSDRTPGRRPAACAATRASTRSWSSRSASARPPSWSGESAPHPGRPAARSGERRGDGPARLGDRRGRPRAPGGRHARPRRRADLDDPRLLPAHPDRARVRERPAARRRTRSRAGPHSPPRSTRSSEPGTTASSAHCCMAWLTSSDVRAMEELLYRARSIRCDWAVSYDPTRLSAAALAFAASDLAEARALVMRSIKNAGRAKAVAARIDLLHGACTPMRR